MRERAEPERDRHILHDINRSFKEIVAMGQGEIALLARLYLHGATDEVITAMDAHFIDPVKRSFHYLAAGEYSAVLDTADACAKQGDYLFQAYFYALSGERDVALAMINEHSIRGDMAAWVEAAAGRPSAAVWAIENHVVASIPPLVEEIVIAYGEQDKTEKMMQWIGEYRRLTTDVQYGRLLLMADAFLPPELEVLESGLDITVHSSDLYLYEVRAYLNRGDVSKACEIAQREEVSIAMQMRGLNAIKRWLIERQRIGKDPIIIYRSSF